MFFWRTRDDNDDEDEHKSKERRREEKRTETIGKIDEKKFEILTRTRSKFRLRF